MLVSSLVLCLPPADASTSYSTPDYSINANVKPFTTSGPITIEYSVSNLSDVTAAATSVEFSTAPLDTPAQSVILGQAAVPALNRWSSVTQTVSFPLPGGLKTGTTAMRLTANVNPARGNGEVKGQNNITYSSFNAQVESPPPLADLTVVSLAAPTATAVGAAIDVTDTVQNVGSGAAGSFAVDYYLDSTQGRTTLASHTVSGLAAQGSSLDAFTVTVPDTLTPGTYTLTVQVNPTGSVAESSTQNNTATQTLTLTAASGGLLPDPELQSANTFRSDSSILPVPALPRPLVHVPFIDPTFGTTITRETDPSMAPSLSTNLTLGLRHEYARLPALNADNTKVIVRVIGGADRGYFEVRDLLSSSLLYKIGAQRGDPEMSWHPTSPNLLFYRTTNEVHIFHTDTGQSETVMSFPQYYAITTQEEGRPSDDWRYYAFLGFPDSSYSTADVVVADLVAKKIVSIWPKAGKPDWVSMSPSGTYVIAQWLNGAGTRVYDRSTLAYLRTAFSDTAHCDFALDSGGNEVLVYRPSSTQAIAELGSPSGSPIAQVRLADGTRMKLLDLGWGWFSNHLSGIASRQHPGWVLLSTYTTPTNTQQPYAREILWLKLDGSGEVRRIAHHHSDQGFDSSGKKDYWAEPQATSSWDGSIVLFSSVWGQPFTEYDLYTVTGHWW
jgi:hypothetical protein